MGNGRGGRTGKLLFFGLITEGCGLEMVGNKGRVDCGMECEAESKPHGTANLFRHIPVCRQEVTSALKYVVKEPGFLRGARSTDFLVPKFCTVNL